MAFTFEVTFTQLLKGQTCQNVVHFRDAVGVMSNQAVAETLQEHWIERIRTIQGIQLFYVQTMVRKLEDPTAAPFILNMNIQGGIGGFDSRLPPVSVVLQKKTNHAGRKGRGRTYIAGWNHDNLESTGTWLAGDMSGRFALLVQLLTESFIDPANSNLQLVLVSPNPGGPIDWRLVTSLTIRATPGYQRRRNIGVGI